MAIDEIAEQIRALDAYAIGGLGTLVRTAQMKGDLGAPTYHPDKCPDLLLRLPGARRVDPP